MVDTQRAAVDPLFSRKRKYDDSEDPENHVRKADTTSSEAPTEERPEATTTMTTAGGHSTEATTTTTITTIATTTKVKRSRAGLVRAMKYPMYSVTVEHGRYPELVKELLGIFCFWDLKPLASSFRQLIDCVLTKTSEMDGMTEYLFPLRTDQNLLVVVVVDVYKMAMWFRGDMDACCFFRLMVPKPVPALPYQSFSSQPHLIPATTTTSADPHKIVEPVNLFKQITDGFGAIAAAATMLGASVGSTTTTNNPGFDATTTQATGQSGATTTTMPRVDELLDSFDSDGFFKDYLAYLEATTTPATDAAPIEKVATTTTGACDAPMETVARPETKAATTTTTTPSGSPKKPGLLKRLWKKIASSVICN